MARVDTLTNYLTDVASAIKIKKGDSTPILASNFDTEIENLPSGGGADLSDYFTPTISSEGYAKMIINIPETTTVSGTSLSNAFSGYRGTTIPLIDTSNVTTMNYMFSNCVNLTTIPLLNTSRVQNMQYMFQNCSSLISIPLIDISSVLGGNLTYLFSGCNNLTTVPILDTSNITTLNYVFENCHSLSDTTLDNILQMCINSNVTMSSRKKLSSLGLTSTYYSTSRITALPHYQDFINAGWSIGY